MTDQQNKELTPPAIEAAIKEIEWLISNAKKGNIPSQWLCDFIARPLFCLTLWRTGQPSLEINGAKPPGTIEALEAYVNEVEGALPIYRMVIKRIKGSKCQN